MCKKILNSLLGGGADDAPNPARGENFQYDTPARVREAPRSREDGPRTSRAGHVGDDDRRRGRLAGLGL